MPAIDVDDEEEEDENEFLSLRSMMEGPMSKDVIAPMSFCPDPQPP